MFSIDTRDDAGGTYTVTLTYLAWGFDWRAHYVAYLGERARDGTVRYDLESWLTLLNDNNQSFADARTDGGGGHAECGKRFRRTVRSAAGRAVADHLLSYRQHGGGVADRRYASLRLHRRHRQSPAPAMMVRERASSIVVTGSRMSRADLAMKAREEDLGDLKLYRVPEPITVAAQSLKQVAFLQKEGVRRAVRASRCLQSRRLYARLGDGRTAATQLTLESVNIERDGLGVALPSGGISVFERVPQMAQFGPLLLADDGMRDYAVAQDVEIRLGGSERRAGAVHAARRNGPRKRAGRRGMGSDARASRQPVAARCADAGRAWVRRASGAIARAAMTQRIKDGEEVIEFTVRAGQTAPWTGPSAALPTPTNSKSNIIFVPLLFLWNKPDT